MVHSSQPLNILEILDHAPFPATKVELIEYAEAHDASEEAMDLIQAMPDRTYSSIRHVNAGLGLTEPLPNEEEWWPSAPSHDLPEDPEHRRNEIESRIDRSSK